MQYKHLCDEDESGVSGCHDGGTDTVAMVKVPEDHAHYDALNSVPV